MLVLLSAKLMLVDLFVSVMKVTVSVAIMQLEVSATLMQVKTKVCDNFCRNYAVGSLYYAGGNHADGILYSALCT